MKHPLDKWLGFRWIYIMRWKRTNQYKIGIAKNPEWRLRDIDDAVEGKVKIVMKKRTFFAFTKEQKLHDIFKNNRFTKRGAGSGKTEWFKFTLIESILARLWLWWLADRFELVVVLVVIVWLLVTSTG